MENDYEILFRFTDDLLLALSEKADNEEFMNFYQEWAGKFIYLPIKDLGVKPEGYNNKYYDEYLNNLKNGHFK